VDRRLLGFAFVQPEEAMRILAGVAGWALASMLAVPAGSLTIDNFEEGPFTLVDTSAPGSAIGEQSGLLGTNVVGGVRLVELLAVDPDYPVVLGTTATASLATTGADDGAAISFVEALPLNGTSLYIFQYDGIADGLPNGSGGALSLDLSSFDVIEVTSSFAGVVTASLDVALWTSTASQFSASVPIVNGVNTFALSSFDTLDLTDVQEIRVDLYGIEESEAPTLTHIEAVVPEPGMGSLVVIGLAGLAFRRARPR
jgi:hypothetical protein